MEHEYLRTTSRRLVIELALVVLLVGLPVDFPRGTSAGQAWSFVLRHPSIGLHVLIGVVILLEAATYLRRSTRRQDRRPALLAGIGAAFVLLAFGAGLAYAGAGQAETALTAMTLGWLGALVTYGVGWRIARRARHPTL